MTNLFLALDKKTLDQSEVKARLESYENDETTAQLLSLGATLLSSAEGRLAQIDSKAMATAAYCGALITFLVSSATFWAKSTDVFMRTAPVLAVVIAGWSGFTAITATYLREVDWFSNDDWLNKWGLADPRSIKKFHVLATWQVVTSHDIAYAFKTSKLERAQRRLSFAIGALLVALLEYVIRQAFL